MTTPPGYYDRYWSRDAAAEQAGMYAALEALLGPHAAAGASWLDVGCGNGRTVGLWARQCGVHYTGVDVAPEAVRQAKDAGLEAYVLEAPPALPFGTASFDTAVCMEVFEHLFEPQLTAAEILRVLRPGGTLLATTPNAAYWRRRLDLGVLGRWNPAGDEKSLSEPWRDPHIRFFTPASLRAMLEASGFENPVVGAHWGVFAADLPGVSRLVTQARAGRDVERRASAPYRLLQARFPSLFGLRLHASARRPA